MDSLSKDTLLAIEQNSHGVTHLQVGAYDNDRNLGVFNNSPDFNDYENLGTAIGNNTYLTKLQIDNISNNVRLTTTNKRFYDGIRHNSSITELVLSAITYKSDINNVALEVLGACQERNILTKLHINTMPFVNSADESRFIESLRVFTNLREITFVHSRLTNDQLLPMVEAIRGHGLLERINLFNNNIGNVGLEALSTLRNLTNIYIADNDITIEGMIAFANSLSQNNCLRELDIEDDYNEGTFDLRVVEDDFCRSLCNTSSINDIYSSNHTLETIPSYQKKGAKLVSLLKLNKSTTSKRHVAIKKILLYSPHIYMEPLFDLTVEEGDRERDLKALPHVISWFETAKEAIVEPVGEDVAESAREDEDDYSSDDSIHEEYVQYDIFIKKKLSANNLEGRKLSAIYQFVSAMPMLFIPDSHDKGGDKKRKRCIA